MDRNAPNFSKPKRRTARLETTILITGRSCITFSMAYLLKVLAPIAFCLTGLASEAHATVLTATGTFSNGSVLTGTLTIDQGIGVITASDLTITGIGEFVDIVSQLNFGPPVYYSAIVNDTTQTEQLSLGLLADSLIGYTGGDLCSENT